MLVWEGVGLGAGGVGDGRTVGLLDVGFGFGLGCELGPDDAGAELGFWAALGDRLARCTLPGECPGGETEGEGLAAGAWLPPGLPEADGVAGAVAAEVAAWLNRFMNPTTPTALSSVARQVRVDSRRSPRSRCAPSRSRCLMSANESGSDVKRPPRTVQGAPSELPGPDSGFRRLAPLG